MGKLGPLYIFSSSMKSRFFLILSSELHFAVIVALYGIILAALGLSVWEAIKKVSFFWTLSKRGGGG